MADGAAVTTLLNRASMGHFVGTGTYRANKVGNLPGIEIPRTRFLGNVILNNPCTVFQVANYISGGQGGRVLASGTANWLMGFYQTYINMYFANGWVYNPNTARHYSPIMYTCTQTGAVSTFYSGSRQLASNGSGVLAPGMLQLGGLSATGGNEPADCMVYEVIAYNRVLSAAELQIVWDYLRLRWVTI
jgi:hypothetical protein